MRCDVYVRYVFKNDTNGGQDVSSCALDSSSQFVFVARMSVRVFAWTICDSMCGDDEGIYSPGKACMCLTIVWSWYSYLDLRATADERTDLGV